MPVLFVIGRVVFVFYFVFAGLQRLMNITASADYIAHRLLIPPGLSAFTSQIEVLVGLSAPQLIALLAGVIELGAGLLIAINVGTRAMAIVLVIFTALAIYYGGDFWDMAAPQREANLIEAMLKVSLLGGLLVFIALGASRPGEPERRVDV
jgi:uncharacterized membrane protein YphA (DoxX/SURF4 family)